MSQRSFLIPLAALWLLLGSGLAAGQAYDPQSESRSELVLPESAERAADEALAEIEGLEHPDATLKAGVFTLTGTADDSAVKARAADAVIAATGVGRIDNQIELSLNMQDRTLGAANRLSHRAQIWIAYLPLIPVAILIVLLFSLLAWLTGRLSWPFGRFTRNPFLQDILRKLTQSAIMLTGILLALEILDAIALVGGVLGAAGVAGIAIGFAFKDLVENYIASVLLSLRQPFGPGDHVLIDGHEGLVTAMNSRTTVLTTFEGNIVRIPNAVVFKTTLVNYSDDPRRRFEFTVGVGYDVDLSRAIEIGVETLLNTRGVMPDPRPFAIVTTLGDSSITLKLFAWVDQTRDDFGKVRSNAMEQVKNRFDHEDIDMPEPLYKIRIQGDPGPTPLTPDRPGAPQPAHRPGPNDNGPTPPRGPGSNQDTAIDPTIARMAGHGADALGSDNLLSDSASRE